MGFFDIFLYTKLSTIFRRFLGFVLGVLPCILNLYLERLFCRRLPTLSHTQRKHEISLQSLVLILSFLGLIRQSLLILYLQKITSTQKTFFLVAYISTIKCAVSGLSFNHKIFSFSIVFSP